MVVVCEHCGTVASEGELICHACGAMLPVRDLNRGTAAIRQGRGRAQPSENASGSEHKVMDEYIHKLDDRDRADHALMGQQTIPSDTVCYPAKLMHGHIEWLLRQKVDAIFYPCMSYNLDEQRGDNHYNCPVVAYYPELLEANIRALQDVPFISNYFGLHRPKDFEKKGAAFLAEASSAAWIWAMLSPTSTLSPTFL